MYLLVDFLKENTLVERVRVGVRCLVAFLRTGICRLRLLVVLVVSSSDTSGTGGPVCELSARVMQTKKR